MSFDFQSQRANRIPPVNIELEKHPTRIHLLLVFIGSACQSSYEPGKTEG